VSEDGQNDSDSFGLKRSKNKEKHMEIQLILNIITIVLLAILIAATLFKGKKKGDMSQVMNLLKQSNAEQSDAVARQIANGTTEQFQRFDVIQKSVQNTLQTNREEINRQLSELGEQIDRRLSAVQHAGSESIDKVNQTLEGKMKALQESNEKRLEQMQAVVDEKLQKTLETRLAQSFELVSKRLESV